MPYTSDDFLSYVRQIDFSTTAQNQFTDAVLLNIADFTLINRICPRLIEIDENYYLRKDIIPFVANQNTYTMPRYAMFNMIHYIERLSAGLPYRLELIPPQRTYFQNSVQQGPPTRCYLQHDTIFFYPTPTSNQDSYHIMYYRRPSRLVVNSAARQVLSVNYATGDVTYVSVPPATFTNSSRHDFYSPNPPFRRVAENIQATAIAGAVQTFPIADVQTITAGDWGCVLDETVFPDLPYELQDFFAELMVMRLGKIQNDTNKYQMSDKEVGERIRSLYDSIRSRHIAQAISIDFANNPFLNPYGY